MLIMVENTLIKKSKLNSKTKTIIASMHEERCIINKIIKEGAIEYIS